jgi:L-fuconolactonase
LQPLLKENNLDGSIAVQARQTIAETNFLLGLASNNSIIKGVVGWVPLCETDVEGVVEKYAAEKNIVGFRHVIHDEPDDLFILRKDFNNGIKCLKNHSLCYDILIFEKHLPQTIKFVDQHPEINMVIDHIAKPRISHSKFDHNWAENIKQLAARENVTCKLSGMVTEVIDGKWDTSLLQPYFDIVLEAFGPDRLMFGSDWPVCLIQSNYTKWVDTIKSFISSLSLLEQSAIMGGNVKRIYLSNK